MKTNQFRAVMLVLLMAVVSLGTVSNYRVGYCDGCKGWNSACWLFGLGEGNHEWSDN